MDYTQLIASLLPLLLQYGPELVKSVSALIHQNPQTAGETDEAYIARLNVMITANLNDAAKNDAAVETAPDPTPAA